MHHPPSSPEGGVLDRRVILIVEDDPTLGTFLVQFFQEETPHFLLHARDTHEALAIVRSLLPDLLVVDDWLPHMNGLELSDRLEGDRDLHALPTLFIAPPIRSGQLRNGACPFSRNRLTWTRCCKSSKTCCRVIFSGSSDEAASLGVRIAWRNLASDVPALGLHGQQRRSPHPLCGKQGLLVRNARVGS